MSCGKAVKLFENIPKIRRVLQTLCDVGLDYLTLGQPAPTLSGGEAQRVKLAAELARPDTGRTLYLLDEPTTGLHFDDIAKLLDVLNRLVDLGNTVVVIEHNLDVIKTADWVIDLGPEAGDGGGYVVAAGTPEDIVAQAAGSPSNRATPATRRRRKPAASAASAVGPNGEPARRSHTGEVLAAALADSPRVPAGGLRFLPPRKRSSRATSKSPRSAARPACPGKSTAAAGTRKIAWAAPATPAAGTAGFSSAWSIASRTRASSPRRIGTPARSSRSPRRRRPKAGSSTPSRAKSGC